MKVHCWNELLLVPTEVPLNFLILHAFLWVDRLSIELKVTSITFPRLHGWHRSWTGSLSQLGVLQPFVYHSRIYRSYTRTFYPDFLIYSRVAFEVHNHWLRSHFCVCTTFCVLPILKIACKLLVCHSSGSCLVQHGIWHFKNCLYVVFYLANPNIFLLFEEYEKSLKAIDISIEMIYIYRAS